MEKNKALLVYEEEDMEKNRWFIGRLTDLAGKKGVCLECCTPEEALAREDVCFLINRSRNGALSLSFEEKGIRSFNNSATVETGNDKLKEYELFKSLGLPVMETVPGDFFDKDIPFGPPYIVKHRRGHGGTMVFKASRKKEIRSLMGDADPGEFIIQKMCDEPGTDMRLYMLGERIVASVVRTSDTDFRSNFSLGGKVSLTEPERYVRDMALEISRALRSDYIGVDLIRDHGKWIVNEMEDAAGARMLYSLTDIDIADLYMCHICEKSSQIP